jgi:hypothetical protein
MGTDVLCRGLPEITIQYEELFKIRRLQFKARGNVYVLFKHVFDACYLTALFVAAIV